MAKEESPKISVSKLQLGLTVKLPLSYTNHPFLFNRIELKEASQIELIKSLGVTYVYLLAGEEFLVEEPETEQSDIETTQEIVEKDLQQETRKAMRLSQQRFIKTINQSREVLGKVGSDPEGAYRASASLVEDLVAHIQETEAPKLALVSSGDIRVSVTQHGISVAVLSMMIGQALDLSVSELRDIALGSLFHDFGKMKVPEDIRNKRGELTTPELNFMKMHPKFGFDLLDKSGLFPKAALNIVLHHHEYIDGSGYPDGLKGNKIPIPTQVVSLANDYEQILSDLYPPSPKVALGYLFKNRAGKHAEPLVAVLVKLLGIYPPGTLVKLADESFAKVMMTTTSVKQPNVWACQPDGSEPKLRFLLQEGIEIEDAVMVEQLPEACMKVLQADSAISFYFSSLEL
ncbi:HD-GYP domain-containing protein [Shewanella gelidii]|uniref:Phosphohydrolase n=1 Tax=Shewanella gelidii TaxID=1642821 RepID=A0A917JW40_9GAMM|nr:HD domain-containing phosphohydrolase [Shewanella gelidii]MCL1098358.1 DUF3391 domain-containing protein [Shewanella gelidii]GGI84625.1 phosphohydrolase [Shewanella gelidii]